MTGLMLNDIVIIFKIEGLDILGEGEDVVRVDGFRCLLLDIIF